MVGAGPLRGVFVGALRLEFLALAAFLALATAVLLVFVLLVLVIVIALLVFVVFFVFLITVLPLQLVLERFGGEPLALTLGDLMPTALRSRVTNVLAPLVLGLLAVPAAAAPADQTAAPPPAAEGAPPRAEAAPTGTEAAPTAAEAAPPAEPWAQISQGPQMLGEVAENPSGHFPPPPPRGRARLVSWAVGVGPGWLALRDAIGRDGQAATNVATRAAAVITADWMVFLGLDHTSTKRGEATFSQTAALFGVQMFLFQRFYATGALGLAWVKESGVPNGLTDGPGYTLSAAVGVEAWRFDHLALTLEVGLSGAQYTHEAWEMGGVRLGCVVF